MSAAHTPTPWTAANGHVYADDGRKWVVHSIADRDGSNVAEMQANAAHIVRCVNSHDALVAALRELLEHHKWNVSGGERGTYSGHADVNALKALAQAEAL